MDLTKAQIRNYVTKKWAHCPYCDSSNIDTDTGEHSENYILKDTVCGDCGEMWTDVYKLVDMNPTSM